MNVAGRHQSSSLADTDAAAHGGCHTFFCCFVEDHVGDIFCACACMCMCVHVAGDLVDAEVALEGFISVHLSLQFHDPKGLRKGGFMRIPVHPSSAIATLWSGCASQLVSNKKATLVQRL